MAQAKRPRYETAADRDREAVAAKKFADALGLEATKMEQGARADFSIVKDGEEIGFIEVKTRTCTSRTYATYHVSADKLRTLNAQALKENKRAALVVMWKDRTGFISIAKFLENASFKQGGRWDRGDKFDVEEMAEVDISLFTFLEG